MAQLESLLNRTALGFAGLTVDDGKRTSALFALRAWLERPDTQSYVPVIEALVERQHWDLLLYNFFRTMPFGTGGRRGPVGVGPNCFNPVTLSTSVEGHVRYLRHRFGEAAPLRVVVAFDVRVFLDAKGRYRGIRTPLDGIRSKDFAMIAAEVYAKGGVEVHMPDPDAGWMLTTPELSYAIRKLGAHGGLNVSASHNHPDDSGGKFYDDRGGQEVPPFDEEFSRFVDAVGIVDRMPFHQARTQGLVHYLEPSLHAGYLAVNAALGRPDGSRSARVVFSNLHGAGDTNAGEVLEHLGFDISYVEAQRPHDGRFPHVPFGIANPEVPETMALAAAQAARLGADLVMATDPDADRIGLMVPDASKNWVFVSGNEIASLITSHRFESLHAAGQLPRHPVFVTTEVTSRLPGTIAAYFGAHVIDDLLVGCKYIADVVAQFDASHHFRSIEGQVSDFVIGLEESHGVMLSPKVRDKDAAGAAVLLAELASAEKDKGRTLLHALHDLYRRFGVHVTAQVSIVIEGAVGMEMIASIQDGFRAQFVGDSMGGETIAFVDDYWDTSRHGPFLSGTDETARNFLSFRLASGARVLARPSGTEPKIKIYTECKGVPLGLDASDAALAQEIERLESQLASITDSVSQQAYGFLGLSMPRYGLRLNSLLPLDARRDFVETFTAELAARATERQEPIEALRRWIADRLAPYGKDPLALVRRAIATWLEESSLPAMVESRIRGAFDLPQPE